MPDQIRKLSNDDYFKIIRSYVKECQDRLRVQIETGNDYHTEVERKRQKGDYVPELDQIKWLDSKAFKSPKNFIYENLEDSIVNKDPSKVSFPEIGKPLGFNLAEDINLPDPSNKEIIQWLFKKHDICDVMAVGTNVYKTLNRKIDLYDPYFKRIQAIAIQSGLDILSNSEELPFNKNTPDKALKSVPSIAGSTRQDDHKFSALLIEFKKLQKTNGVKDITIKENQPTYDLFVELYGDIQVSRVDKSIARDFLRYLLKLPKNFSKKYPTMAVLEVIEHDFGSVETISAKTVGKHIDRMKAFYNWLVSFEYVATNPFTNLKPKRKGGIIRESYSDEQLVALFSTPIYQGCAGLEQPSLYTPGAIVPFQLPIFWIPLIALYSGARLNEICSLRHNDVKQEAGVWILNINDEGEGKTLKTSNSKRSVPVHKNLLKLGFLNLIKANGSDRIFNLSKDTRGTYGGLFSKQYAYFAKKFLFKGDMNCFHSFRHTFIDAMRENNTPRDISHDLTGHSDVSSVQDRYGSKRPLSAVKKEWVDKVNYPPIEPMLWELEKKIPKKWA